MGLLRRLTFFAGLLLVVTLLLAAGTAFRTSRNLQEHYRKHGHEFGRITISQYLSFAQEFRDLPAGGNILEARRPDGVITRFDRRKGWFLACDPDKTIRTFFIPAAGESYFRRQARR
jgi:pyocin large subunit-like protein